MRNTALLIVSMIAVSSLSGCHLLWRAWAEDDQVAHETDAPKEIDQPAEETAAKEPEKTEPKPDAKVEEPDEEQPEGYVDEAGEFCLLPPRAQDGDLSSSLKTGEMAPDFNLVDSQTGEDVKLSDYRGKTVLLFFWASWCPTCKMACRKRGSLWKMMNVIDDNPDSNVMILGVGTGTDDNPDTQNAFLETNGCTWVSTHDGSNDVEGEYGVLGVPTCVVVGSDGKILTFGRYERDYRDSVLEYLKQSCVQDRKTE